MFSAAFFVTRYWREILVSFIVIAVLSVCSYVSYSVASAHVEEVAAARAAAVEQAFKRGSTQTIAREAALSQELARRDQEITSLRQEIKRYGSITYKTAVAHAQKPADPSQGRAADHHDDLLPVLSVGAVGLLNYARAGSHGAAPTFGDAEGQAPSDVGIEEFIDNDLQVVGQYHELAERHSELVDYVNRACLNITTEKRAE